MLPRALVRHVVHPLHERLRGRGTLRIAALYAAHDRGSAAALAAWHEQRLAEQLSFAAREVPWYRERVGARRAELAQFPLLSKAMVRAAGSALCAESFRGPLIPLATGGSSGEPLRFWSDAEREASQLAAKLRSRAWFGLHAGHRETDLWGSPIELAPQARLRKLSAWLLGVRLLPAFELNAQRMDAFGPVLRDGCTDFVYGYASALARYARHLKRMDSCLRPGTLKLVISTAEVLLPADRRDIAEALGAPVANEFGCRDGGLIAHDCPRGALHVMQDAVHVEVLREDGSAAAAGESGEVVLTNLWARGFPLIRYRTGDRAAWSSTACACGLPHPVLEAVEGRMTDSLVRSDGARVHGLALIYILREQRGVERFRCTQHADHSVSVEVQAADAMDRPALEAIVIRSVKKVLGEAVPVRCEFSAELRPLPSGKHRYIVCEVPDVTS